MTRVLLADDHPLVRASLRALLAQLPEVAEVIEASDGLEAVGAVARHRPDIVLMDISMPGMNGLDAMSQILNDAPDTAVIILSMHSNEELVWRALRSGASGYLVKAAAVEELLDALRAVSRGETYVSAAVRRIAANEPPEGAGELAEDPLTPRQREILRLIAEGMSSKEIAETLKIRIKTVESHRTQLMKRLGIHRVAGLVRYAIRNGIVSGE